MYDTVQLKTGNPSDDIGINIIENANFSIGNEFVKGTNTWHKKISNQIYQGAIKVNLPQYRPAISNVEFNTDSILHQKGQWTVNFQIKK